MMMMIANIMAMFIIIDEVDDSYGDDNDEDFDLGHNPLYNYDYYNNLSHAYDNNCDLDHLKVRIMVEMMFMMIMIKIMIIKIVILIEGPL